MQPHVNLLKKDPIEMLRIRQEQRLLVSLWIRNLPDYARCVEYLDCTISILSASQIFFKESPVSMSVADVREK